MHASKWPTIIGSAHPLNFITEALFNYCWISIIPYTSLPGSKDFSGFLGILPCSMTLGDFQDLEDFLSSGS